MPADESRRKDAHLELCLTEEVEPAENDPLFGDVHLVHEPLPELAAGDVDSSCPFLGKRLASPLVITGMSGGPERAGALNRDLAKVAEELQIGFGVGSQRAMLASTAVAETFRVREAAPRVALLGNIGLWQARSLKVDGVRRLMDAIGADAMAVHLNAAQEMIQPEGDRDFRDGLSTIAALARSLGGRLIIKETGCGIGPATARKLVDAGVEIIDVSGLGGTSWVRVEALRARGTARALGASYSGWGIPSAACVHSVARAIGPRALLVASGGIRDGLAAAKAIALGAQWVGVALPILRAWETAGAAGARQALIELMEGIRLAMVLTGSRTLKELAARPPVIGPTLGRWIEGLERLDAGRGSKRHRDAPRKGRLSR
jgi:isopentenyl-diphosphate delta-isomerase